MSKYCLQHSPVPVIVVRPTSKRAKTKRKRLQDPSRTGYRDLLDKSGAAGGHLLDTDHRHSLMLDEIQQAGNEDEAAAVAKAVGFVPPPDEDAPPKTPDSITSGLVSGENSPDDTRDIGPVLKSPELRNLDTPVDSEASEDDEDEDGGVPMIPPMDSPAESESLPRKSESLTDENEKAEEEKEGDSGKDAIHEESSPSISPGTSKE